MRHLVKKSTKDDQNVRCALDWRGSRTEWITKYWFFKTVKAVFTAWEMHVSIHFVETYGVTSTLSKPLLYVASDFGERWGFRKGNNDNKHSTVRSDSHSQTELLLEELLKTEGKRMKHGFQQGSLYPTWRYMPLHTEIAAFKLLIQCTLQCVITKPFDQALPWILEPIKKIIVCVWFCFVLFSARKFKLLVGIYAQIHQLCMQI